MISVHITEGIAVKQFDEKTNLYQQLTTKDMYEYLIDRFYNARRKLELGKKGRHHNH